MVRKTARKTLRKTLRKMLRKMLRNTLRKMVRKMVRQTVRKTARKTLGTRTSMLKDCSKVGRRYTYVYIIYSQTTGTCHCSGTQAAVGILKC